MLNFFIEKKNTLFVSIIYFLRFFILKPEQVTRGRRKRNNKYYYIDTDFILNFYINFLRMVIKKFYAKFFMNV